MLEMLRSPDPVLVSVKGMVLLVPTVIVPKFSSDGSETVGSETGAVNVIVALLDFVESATEMATTRTEVVPGMLPGAVYVIATPLREFWLEIVPQPGEHAAPFCASVQATPFEVLSLSTVAVACDVPPSSTDGGTTDTDTLMSF